jgi:hypothetical protein
VGQSLAEGLGAVDGIHIPDPTGALPTLMPLFADDGVVRKELLQARSEQGLTRTISLGDQGAVVLQLPDAGPHLHGQLAAFLEQGAKNPPLLLTVCVHATD